MPDEACCEKVGSRDEITEYRQRKTGDAALPVVVLSPIALF